MKRPSIYVKMKVLGAIDVAEGKTRHQRIHNVAAMTFVDEQGHPNRFTWRTIQTWYYRYKNHGVTGMDASPRSDKGRTRKVTPEEVLEAINAALPHFRETCMATLSGAAGDCPAFSCGDTRVVGLLSGYDRLKTFALIEKMRRMIPLLSQSYDTIVAPEFDTIEYDETTGITGVINQLTAPRRQAEAA